ncbi:acyltransferase [bacterium]|nr:acyltransferase [bacterium]
MSNPTSRPFFPSLDGLRTIACLQVFLFHAFSPFVTTLGVSNLHSLAFIHIFLNGHGGVSLFFVLSGFLITYLMQQEIAKTGTIHIGNFYLRRVLRIWPLYYTLLAIYLGLFPILRASLGSSSPYTLRPAFYLAFLGNFDAIHLLQNHGQGFDPVGITWSVGIEEQFYLVWPLLLFIVPWSRHWLVFVCLLLASYAFRCSTRLDPPVLYFHSFSVFCDLALGALTAYLCFHWRKQRGKLESLPDRSRRLLYLAGAGVLFVNGYEGLGSWWAALLRLPTTCFFAFVIADQCFHPSEALKLSRFKLLCRWGKYTYSLYLLHPTALFVLEVLLFKVLKLERTSLMTQGLYGLLGLPLGFTLAYLSYHYVEKKFLELKKRF